MRIGVVGDTHDRMANIEQIVDLFDEAGIDRIVHTGDITQPLVLEAFAGLQIPFLGVYGNNDLGARVELQHRAATLGMQLVDPPHVVEWSDRRILVVHDPTHAEIPAAREVDLVLHGHTHRHRLERNGETLIFNPGECAGMMAGYNSIGVVDLPTLEAHVLKF